MKRILTLAAGLLIAVSGTVSAVGDKAGTTTGEFLRLPAGAKPAAMGEAYAGLADDAYSMYFNVAGLAKVRRQQALFAHTMYYLDVNHEYAAYARPFMKGGIGASVTYLMTTFEKRSGDTETADANGSIGDMAVSAGYARPLCCGIDGGVAVKYISSKLDTYTATSVAFDLGLKKTLNDTVTAGLSVQNLGGSLKYAGETVAIGTTLDAGIAARGLLLPGLSLALDYRTLINASGNSINAGAEYLYRVSDDWSLAPRAGFVSNGQKITAGFGIGWQGYRLDYAFNPHADLGLAHRISFDVSF